MQPRRPIYKVDGTTEAWFVFVSRRNKRTEEWGENIHARNKRNVRRVIGCELRRQLREPGVGPDESILRKKTTVMTYLFFVAREDDGRVKL